MLQVATSVFQLEYTINNFPGSNIKAVLIIIEAVLRFRIPRLLACRPSACHTHPCNSHGLALEFAASPTYLVSAIICITAARITVFNAHSPRLNKMQTRSGLVLTAFSPRLGLVLTAFNKLLNAFRPRVHLVRNTNALYLVSGRFCTCPYMYATKNT